MVLLPFSMKLLAAYYPLVPSLSIQMETALVECEASATSLNVIRTLAARLAGAWTKASLYQPSAAQSGEQQARSGAALAPGPLSNSLPTSHKEPSTGRLAHLAEESMHPIKAGSSKGQLDSGKPQLQVDSATSSLPCGPVLSTERGPHTTGSANGSAGLETDSTSFARVPCSMPLQQLQGLHRLLAGAAGVSDVVSIFDDLHSGMFSMAPSHQLLPGVVASLTLH